MEATKYLLYNKKNGLPLSFVWKSLNPWNFQNDRGVFVLHSGLLGSHLIVYTKELTYGGPLDSSC